MKNTIIYMAFAIILGIVIGIYFYKEERTNADKVLLGADTNYISNTKNITSQDIAASFSEAKIGPNTEIIVKTQYKTCGHIKATKLDSKDYINMTKEEFEKKNPNLKIKTFNEDKVILMQEENDSCKEHYVLKDLNGYIYIYSLDESDKENALIEKTEIATKYLSEQDKKQLSEGIKIYSKTDLNKLIEDFES